MTVSTQFHGLANPPAFIDCSPTDFLILAHITVTKPLPLFAACLKTAPLLARCLLPGTHRPTAKTSSPSRRYNVPQRPLSHPPSHSRLYPVAPIGPSKAKRVTSCCSVVVRWALTPCHVHPPVWSGHKSGHAVPRHGVRRKGQGEGTSARGLHRSTRVRGFRCCVGPSSWGELRQIASRACVLVVVPCAQDMLERTGEG